MRAERNMVAIPDFVPPLEKAFECTFAWNDGRERLVQRAFPGEKI